MANNNKSYIEVVKGIFDDPLYRSIKPGQEKKKETPKEDYIFGVDLKKDIDYLVSKNSSLAPMISPFKGSYIKAEGGKVTKYRTDGGKFYKAAYSTNPKWKQVKGKDYYEHLGNKTQEHVNKINSYMKDVTQKKLLPLQKMVKSPLEQYMGAQGMKLNGALVFPKELGNHTMTMNRPNLQPLDIVSTKGGKVQNVVKNAKPGSGDYNLYGDQIVEVPAGMAKDIKPGDDIELT